MKKMNGFRKLLASALCLCLALGNGVLAFAEDPEVKVVRSDETGKYDVTVDIPGDTGKIEVSSYNANDFTIEVNGKAVDPNNLTGANVDSVEVSVKEGSQISDGESSAVLIAVYDSIDVTVNAEDSKVTAAGEIGISIVDNPLSQGQQGNTIDVQVGDVEAQGDGYQVYGMRITAYDGSDINVNAGNITAGVAGSNQADVVEGINVFAAGSSDVALSVGNVTAKDGENNTTAIYVDSHEKSAISVVASGNVEAEEEYGEAIEAESHGESAVMIAVLENDKSAGDVIATGSGAVGIDATCIDDSSLNLYIEGTVFGSGAGVDLWGHTEMAAWQIAAGEGGTAIKNALNPINYLIKLGEGLTNQNISTANHKTVTYDKEENEIIYGNETTDNKYAYHTAVEEEEVTLSLQLQDGKALDGVYYNAEDKDDDDKVKEGANLLTVGQGLTKKDDGIFLLKMLRGGGMLLGLKTHTHDYSEYVGRTKEPTCSEIGLDLYKCKYCDATITETVAVKSDNHSLADGAAKAVTCTEDGWDAYQYCTRCSYSTKVVIPASGHNFSVDVAAKAASCEEDGYTAHKECSRCHAKNDAYQVIPASGHDCEDKLTAGEKTHWYACKKCDAKKGETEHTPGTPVKEKEQAAQVGVAGSYEEVVYCTACGAEINRKTVETDPLPEKKDAIVSYDSQDSDDTIVAEYKVNTVKDDTSLIVKITGAEDQDGEFAGVMLGLLSNMDSNIPDEMKADLEKLQRNLSSAKAAVSIPADISADAEADHSIAAGGPFRAVGTKYPATITIELTDPDTFVGIMIWQNGKWVKLDTTVNDDGTVTFVLDEPSILCIVYSEVIIA